MTQPQSIELSSIGYAEHRKKLVSVINQLRAVGAQTELDLPRVVVIGKQSAGKSSVVEAISGIDVPRDAGSCTRCPIECRLSYSPTWCCKVSIRFEVSASGDPVKEVTEISFGSVVYEKSKVGETLRRAQHSALHPEINLVDIEKLPLDALKGSNSGGSSIVSFTRNVVCIDVAGPELTDLSFIDLPGLIQNAEPSVVNLVENLTKSYIKGSSLILVVMPVTDDFENQRAWWLASEEDPQGNRTIGVLTKPDLLNSNSQASQDQWLDVLSGKKHVLRNGYFITKLPDDKQRSSRSSTKDAQAAEAGFFASSKMWSGAVSQSRIGMKNLKQNLSNHLVQLISKSIPVLRTDAHRALSDCQKILAILPPEIKSEPGVYLLELIRQLSHQVESFVNGTRDAKTLMHANRKSYDDFAQAIHSSRPNFYPSNEIPLSPAGITRSLNLIDMRQHISSSVTRELPNNVPYAAKAALIAEFQDSWSLFVADCTESVRSSLHGVLSSCVKQVASRHPRLLEELQCLITQLIDDHISSTEIVLKSYLKSEKTPYTQNKYDLELFKVQWLSKYEAERAEILSCPAHPTPSPDMFKFTSVKGFSWNEKTVNHRNLSLSSQARLKGNVPEFFKAPPVDSTAVSQASASFFKAPATVANSTPSKFVFAPPKAQVEKSTESPPPAPSVTKSTQIAESFTSGSTKIMDEQKPPLKTVSNFEGARTEGQRIEVEEYERELGVMAEVQAYFDVSHKRIIDIIPMLLDSSFIMGVADNLHTFFITKLGLGTSGADFSLLRNYIADDPNVMAQREDLLARQGRLRTAQQQLNSISW